MPTVDGLASALAYVSRVIVFAGFAYGDGRLFSVPGIFVASLLVPYLSGFVKIASESYSLTFAFLVGLASVRTIVGWRGWSPNLV